MARDSFLRKLSFIFLSLILILSACVNQHPEKVTKIRNRQELSKERANNNFSDAVNNARKKVLNLDRKVRVVATSPAVAEITDKLDIDLVGVCKSNIHTLADRYKNVEKVGMPMSVDIEVLASLKPDWVLSPVSLMGDFKPKYEAIATDYAFLNLNSITGMYKSIKELGFIFGKEDKAESLIEEFNNYIKEYRQKHDKKNKPKVLILMGLPGSYIIATDKSYVGSLVKLAGGENVYTDKENQFLNINTEDMKNKEPDVILRAAHALPDKVKDMFDKDFRENDIWKHFKAVKNNRVFDLSYEKFGMSAKFNYPQALEELEEFLYPTEGK